MYVPNVDAGLVLQAASTQTASFTSAWLDLGRGYSPAGLGTLLAAVVVVTAMDKTSGDETYAFKLQQAPAAFSTPTIDQPTAVELDSPDAANITDAGLAVSASSLGVILPKAIVTSRFIRLVLTVGGTTPSITYSGNVGM